MATRKQKSETSSSKPAAFDVRNPCCHEPSVSSNQRPTATNPAKIIQHTAYKAYKAYRAYGITLLDPRPGVFTTAMGWWAGLIPTCSGYTSRCPIKREGSIPSPSALIHHIISYHATCGATKPLRLCQETLEATRYWWLVHDICVHSNSLSLIFAQQKQEARDGESDGDCDGDGDGVDPQHVKQNG